MANGHAPLGPDPDFDLVQKAKEGDTQALGDLLMRHKKRIINLGLSMTSSLEDAEDLTQETFMQVQRKIKTFAGDSRFSTWLYRVAMNTVLMNLRRKKWTSSLDEMIEQNEQEGKTLRQFGRPDRRLIYAGERRELVDAVNSLPFGYREVIILAYIEGYEHQEIAELTGKTVGNSKSQLHKAKVRLLEILNPLCSLQEFNKSYKRIEEEEEKRQEAVLTAEAEAETETRESEAI